SALSERAFAGERIILPAYSVSGGSGNLNVSVVVKNGENTVDVKNNSFTVESAGNYIISYVVTDYIGKSVEKSFNIQTEISQKPVIRLNDIVVPTEYKNGAIILNVPKAYDYYTFLGYGEEVPVKVYAVSYTAGTQVSDANYVLVSANETGDYVYIPSTSADRMKIRYEATSLMGETEVVYSNEIVLYSVNSLVKYWGFDSNDVSLAVGALESGDIEYFFRPLKNGAKINYLIPLQASEFSLGLSFENGYANFNKVSVVLSDSTMANEVITLSLTTKNHDSVYVTTGNGNKSYTKGEICDVDYISTILFKLKSKTELVDANGNLILNLTNFDSGAEFNGFTSDKIYVSVIVDEIVSTSANNRFSIASFYNQGRYLFSTGNDVNGPKVVTNGSVDTVYDYLETIVLPTAKAYDMCSTNCTTNVTVVDPNGTTILSGVKANRTNSFVASVYGVYTITYTSRDEEGNVTNLKYLATVVDTENPVIEISGQVTTTARVNSYLTVRSFTATDNVSTNANILKYVFIETPNYGYKAVQVNGYSTATYKFEVAGEYKLVYVAMDKAGNIAYKTFTITVT
ncbi:MAG: hypothetical protein J6R88_01995, partial [Clostridia bacterium]|nr:hypothetical protein [Clostridia bacterium]